MSSLVFWRNSFLKKAEKIKKQNYVLCFSMDLNKKLKQNQTTTSLCLKPKLIHKVVFFVGFLEVSNKALRLSSFVNMFRLCLLKLHMQIWHYVDTNYR